MAAFARARRVYLAPAAEPNVIPFIDVLLVLLIIFMVTAPKPTIDLRVDLPRPGPIRVVAIRPTIVELHKTGAWLMFLSPAMKFRPRNWRSGRWPMRWPPGLRSLRTML